VYPCKRFERNKKERLMKYYSSPNYELSIAQTQSSTTIHMSVLKNIYTTKEIPLTKKLLKKTLPSVLTSKCFNPSNFPFWREVEQTETGHLFEHILLEYLCIQKIDSGAKESIYNGTTYWNWRKQPLGTFTINIDIGQREHHIFNSAVIPAVTLMEQVFQQKEITSTTQSFASNFSEFL